MKKFPKQIFAKIEGDKGSEYLVAHYSMPGLEALNGEKVAVYQLVSIGKAQMHETTLVAIKKARP